MPNPGAVNKLRDELKGARPDTTEEANALLEADGGAGVTGTTGPTGTAAQQEAEKQGTRVWNQWDDREAAEAQARDREQTAEERGGADTVAIDQRTGVTGVTGPTGPTGTTGTASQAAAKTKAEADAAQLEKASNKTRS